MSIQHLAQLIHVSEATIRRDLNALQRQGLVNRVFGGVVLANASPANLPFSLRSHDNKATKAIIAAQAVEHIYEGTTIILDGSTTVKHMLPLLNPRMKLTIISNSIWLCQQLIGNGISTYCTGGLLNEKDGVLLGSYAESILDLMHADIMFFSSNCLDNEGNISDCSENVVSYLRAALRRAKKRVFLCDSSKFNKTATHKLCNVANVDMVLSDQPLPSELLETVGNARNDLPRRRVSFDA